MACFHPIRAYRSLKEKTPNGKQLLAFKRGVLKGAFDEINLPCGRCIGCRIERSRQWALRCVHEASLWSANCFITLTYDDDHVDSNGSLVKSDFQKFMKRLRKKFSGVDLCQGRYPIRYYMCGEYGEDLFRPHYHACIFNFDFFDKTLWSVKNGNRLYRSDSLAKLWPFGYSLIGDVTWDSAAYVARYINKKLNGAMSRFYYNNLDVDTGELIPILPEYSAMSRRPGIGRGWFDRFCSDVFPKDYVTHNGTKFRPPKYYDKIYDMDNPADFEEIQKKRLTRAAKCADNCTVDRLKVREKVLNAKVSKLVRSFEYI